MATYKTIKYIVPTEVVEHTDSINALADVDTSTATPTEGQTIKWDGTNWVPGNIEAFVSGVQKAIFGFGSVSGSYKNVTNLVSSTGVVATDTTGVGTARSRLAAAGYGGDKAIFGFGNNGSNTNVTNLVSNAGVVATDTTGVGSAREKLAASGYGGDKAIFGFGYGDGTGFPGDTRPERTSMTNLVSNTGVVASDTTGVGTARINSAAAKYGSGKAIFGFGQTGSGYTSITNLVSNTGVMASDTTGVGLKRFRLAATGYGGDKAIFAFGGQSAPKTNTNPYNGSTYTNNNYSDSTSDTTCLVSNLGVVASDITGVGTARTDAAAAGYGGDKAIFGFGEAKGGVYYIQSYNNFTNLVSNTGVIASHTYGVGAARTSLSAASYSTTA